VNIRLFTNSAPSCSFRLLGNRHGRGEQGGFRFPVLEWMHRAGNSFRARREFVEMSPGIRASSEAALSEWPECVLPAIVTRHRWTGSADRTGTRGTATEGDQSVGIPAPEVEKQRSGVARARRIGVARRNGAARATTRCPISPTRRIRGAIVDPWPSDARAALVVLGRQPVSTMERSRAGRAHSTAVVAAARQKVSTFDGCKRQAFWHERVPLSRCGPDPSPFVPFLGV
jgi:hypothetical protein